MGMWYMLPYSLKSVIFIGMCFLLMRIFPFFKNRFLVFRADVLFTFFVGMIFFDININRVIAQDLPTENTIRQEVVQNKEQANDKIEDKADNRQNAINSLDPLQMTIHEKAGECVEGSEQTCLAIKRTAQDGKESKILVIRTGITDETGIYAICSPQDDEPEGTPYTGIFSESGRGGIVIVVGKNRITVPLAKVTQSSSENPEYKNTGSVEGGAGSAKLLDTVDGIDNTKDSATEEKDKQAKENSIDEKEDRRLQSCGVEYKPTVQLGAVQIKQGNTILQGKKLTYQASTGIALIEGPVTFKRDATEGREALEGKADKIEVNVDNEQTLLIGSVEIKTGSRTSKADKVEYNDAKGEARLYPSDNYPARTVSKAANKEEWLEIKKGSIYYNLETNEVSIRNGDIKGEWKEQELP